MNRDEELAAAIEAAARAGGLSSDEVAKLRAGELAAPPVAPAPASAAQARALEARLNGAIPGGSCDPPGIASAPARRRRRPPATRRPEESPRYRRHLGELARRGARACRPQDVPRRVWSVVAQIQSDVSGGAGARILEELPPGLRWRTHKAATCGGRPLSHVAARTTVAIAWFFWTMGRATKRRGYVRVTDAVPMGTLRAVVRNPVTGQPYSRAGLCATSWGKDRREEHHSGALTRLRRTGALLRIQPPAGLVPLALVGPSGYAFAQTWISAEAAYGAPPEERAQGPT